VVNGIDKEEEHEDEGDLESILRLGHEFCGRVNNGLGLGLSVSMSTGED
jgi:hypothetical protein